MQFKSLFGEQVILERIVEKFLHDQIPVIPFARIFKPFQNIFQVPIPRFVVYDSKYVPVLLVVTEQAVAGAYLKFP